MGIKSSKPERNVATECRMKSYVDGLLSARMSKNRDSIDLACHVGLNLMSSDPTVYHNDRHVKDVANFTREILGELKGEFLLDQNMSKCLYVAALLHDVCHPAGGANKDAHENVLARTSSTHMETIHSEVAKSLLLHTNSFACLDDIQRNKNIDIITEIILATELKTYLAPEDERTSQEMMLAKLIIRCADLCHITKSLEYHLLNVKALNNECGVIMTAKQNADFIEKFTKPQFIKLHEFCESERSAYWIKQIDDKIRYWRGKEAAGL